MVHGRQFLPQQYCANALADFNLCQGLGQRHISLDSPNAERSPHELPITLIYVSSTKSKTLTLALSPSGRREQANLGLLPSSPPVGRGWGMRGYF
ncbi:MAG: hypothetical protein HC916_08775 [Coleofasciculaceae cyanobacterium SM2_1_6]|nr:hypothetical protein [Coleofasciculaceae cyanobacterium SM2_1_6]